MIVEDAAAGLDSVTTLGGILLLLPVVALVARILGKGVFVAAVVFCCCFETWLLFGLGVVVVDVVTCCLATTPALALLLDEEWSNMRTKLWADRA